MDRCVDVNCRRSGDPHDGAMRPFLLAVLIAAAPLEPSAARAAAASPVTPATTTSDPTVALLQELIRIDSTNAPGDTRAIAARLKALFDAAGVPNEIIVAPNGKAAHFIARLKGDGRRRPVLVATHTDVVPAERARWTADPFGGELRDGFVYGRGAMDNKGAVAAFAQAVLRLARDPAPRSRDVIFLAEADEEQGQFNTTWLAQAHWDKIDAEFALNEGGRTLIGADGRVREMQVSYADKLTLNLKLRTQGRTGHSSRPLPLDETANGQLIAALARLQAHRSPITISPAVADYLRTTAKLNPGPLATAVGDLLAAPDAAAQAAAADRLIAAESGGWGVEGLLRNTLVITMLTAGQKPNVIPGEAEAVMNARLLPGVTVDAYMAELRAVIGNPRAELEIVSARPKAELADFYARRSRIAPSPLDTELFAAIRKGAEQTWPGVTVLPTLLVAATDATPWRERGVPVYGLGPIAADAATALRVHGDDERAATASVRTGADFAYRILKSVTAR